MKSKIEKKIITRRRLRAKMGTRKTRRDQTNWSPTNTKPNPKPAGRLKVNIAKLIRENQEIHSS